MRAFMRRSCACEAVEQAVSREREEAARGLFYHGPRLGSGRGLPTVRWCVSRKISFIHAVCGAVPGRGPRRGGRGRRSAEGVRRVLGRVRLKMNGTWHRGGQNESFSSLSTHKTMGMQHGMKIAHKQTRTRAKAWWGHAQRGPPPIHATPPRLSDPLELARSPVSARRRRCSCPSTPRLLTPRGASTRRRRCRRSRAAQARRAGCARGSPGWAAVAAGTCSHLHRPRRLHPLCTPARR